MMTRPAGVPREIGISCCTAQPTSPSSWPGGRVAHTLSLSLSLDSPPQKRVPHTSRTLRCVGLDATGVRRDHTHTTRLGTRTICPRDIILIRE